MLCNVIFLLQVTFSYCFNIDSLYSFRRDLKKNYYHSFFSSLENYQVNAKQVPDNAYQWIARVIHSKKNDLPHICTASCIRDGIFITAARCIYSLKVEYTTIIYKNLRLRVRAFVIPSNGSKQAFDDIGFIIVEKKKTTWSVVKLFDKSNRTDEEFKWFDKLDSSPYKAVGYATEKGLHNFKTVDRVFILTELDVTIGMDICSTILTLNHRFEGFKIPCYHSCTVKQFKSKTQQCKNYHGVEGGAVIHANKDYLLGLATWGPYWGEYELPVGLSVANSVNFFQDYECAKKIWADEKLIVSEGYYQKLC